MVSRRCWRWDWLQLWAVLWERNDRRCDPCLQTTRERTPTSEEKVVGAKTVRAMRVGIYGSITVKIVLQHYASASSLYIQEGRQDKWSEDCPPSRCSGTQSCPDATSGPSSPDAHYSDNAGGGDGGSWPKCLPYPCRRLRQLAAGSCVAFARCSYGTGGGRALVGFRERPMSRLASHTRGTCGTTALGYAFGNMVITTFTRSNRVGLRPTKAWK